MNDYRPCTATTTRRIATLQEQQRQEHQQLQHQPEVDTMEPSLPQHPQHESHGHLQGAHGAHLVRGDTSIAAVKTGDELDSKPPAKRDSPNQQRRDASSSHPRPSLSSPSPSWMPLADRLSSSLASIAFQQPHHRYYHRYHGSSAASSSDCSSNNRAVVTNGNRTETNTSATASATTNSGSSNNGSGGEDRDSTMGGMPMSVSPTASLPPLPSPSPAMHEGKNNSRCSNGNNGMASTAATNTFTNNTDGYGRHSEERSSLRNRERRASGMAQLAPQSFLSSSGNEARGSDYRASKQTLHPTTSLASNKRKKTLNGKPKIDPSTTSTSSEDGRTTLYHKRHHHTAKSMTGPTKLQSQLLQLPQNNPVARKKRSHPEHPKSPPATPSSLKRCTTAETAAAASSASATEDDENYGSNSSSGSGTETGYAGSASSNDNLATMTRSNHKDYRHHTKDSRTSTSSGHSSSSDIPDFSSGTSERSNGYAFTTSPSLSSSNEDDSGEEDSEDSHRRTTTELPQAPGAAEVAMTTSPVAVAPAPATPRSIKNVQKLWPQSSIQQAPTVAMSKKPSPTMPFPDVSQFAKITRPKKKVAVSSNDNKMNVKQSRRQKQEQRETRAPILTLGSDLMAHVLTFLEPPEIQRVLTMSLSKNWRRTFSNQQELWRVLCLSEPFKAQVTEEDFSSSSSSNEDDDDDDGSLSSFSANDWNRDRVRKPQKLGKYRLLYTSFVRCMKYLARMKEDVLHGRPPSMIDYGGSSVVSPRDIGSNRSLRHFLAGARGVVELQRAQENEASIADGNNNDDSNIGGRGVAHATNLPILSVDDGSNSYSSSVESRSRKRKKSREPKNRKKPKFGRSMLTDRLLGPSASGQVNPENVTLPWSCALYSIVNWMVAFADVEGIQVMCLKVLPYLLEDEQQRITAQRAGLTDVVLKGMILFPNSVQLHTASFHTLVLLARPLGGREGMLFHSSMVNSAGIFSGGGAAAAAAARDNAEASDNASGEITMFSGGASNNGKNGIAVMLDSMRRFESDEALQAMSCWSLVNIALAPIQKEVLVKLGGIEATTNAMMRHPHNAEVQFRALFALINLVIPSVSMSEENAEEQENNLDDVASGSYAEELDEMVNQITKLVVLAMKNFCSSEAILNRACLVLHNLSLTQAYHTTLLWTPNCYQMLEWALANYRGDMVLQQSAAGTLHRLQVTLSNDDNLRSRFAASIQAQQQVSLEAAHQEALNIYERQEQLRGVPDNVAGA